MLPLVLAATTAAATAIPIGSSSPSDSDAAPPKLRSGAAVGLTLGAGLGAGAGYPNNLNDIGNGRYYEHSGLMPGFGGTLLIMGALTDYLNFGFWFGEASFRSGQQRATQFGVGLRVEAFPLLTVAAPLGGLGFFSQFGLGAARLVSPGQPDAGGTQSVIGLGAFYEWGLGHFLGGHFGVGPSIEYDATFTQPYDQNGFLASARLVFYGGP